MFSSCCRIGKGKYEDSDSINLNDIEKVLPVWQVGAEATAEGGSFPAQPLLTKPSLEGGQAAWAELQSENCACGFSKPWFQPRWYRIGSVGRLNVEDSVLRSYACAYTHRAPVLGKEILKSTKPPDNSKINCCQEASSDGASIQMFPLQDARVCDAMTTFSPACFFSRSVSTASFQ